MSKHNKYRNNYTSRETNTNTENVIENGSSEVVELTKTDNIESESEFVENSSVESVTKDISNDTSENNDNSEIVLYNDVMEFGEVINEIEEGLDIGNINSNSLTETKEEINNTAVEVANDNVKETTVDITVDISEPQEVSIPKHVSLYMVGTDLINNKCINQVTVTTDLELAKEECLKARDTQKKSYYVFDKSGNVIYSIEYATPKDNYFRVGTDWKNGVCINQKLSSTNFNQACASANDNTKLTGVIHHVFDPSGKVVFSAKKKLILLSYKKKGNKNVNWYS